MKKTIGVAALWLSVLAVSAQTVSRGPYLQMVSQSAATIRWRTDVNTNSKVNYGLSPASLNLNVSDPGQTLEHELRLTSLSPDTKYYYSIGSLGTILDAASNNFFTTAPAQNSDRKIRIAAFGDCGIPSLNQANVRDQYLNYTGGNPADVWLLLGDNAYSYGYDYEYQTGFFDSYKNTMLRNHPLFPTPGNHDYRNDTAFSADRTLDYYKNFTLPTNAECGGVPSHTEAYYSFDWGSVHFLSLDSYGTEDGNTTRLYDTSGAQVAWIKQDLAANTKNWVIAYFHHPPFTQGGHISDVEDELVRIRRQFIRILERYGVDLILSGHSHAYERSYLLKDYYSNNASFVKATHTADSSAAFYDGSLSSCPYHYDNGKFQHGTVYVVSGSAGQSNGISSPMNALPFVFGNDTNGGSFYLEVDNNRLDAKMIGYDGQVKDRFTIMKDINKIRNTTIAPGASAMLTASWPGNYVWGHGPMTRTVTVSPTSSASYTVRDSLNCIEDSFRVTVTAILPLKLLSFEAHINGLNNAALNWHTSLEKDNYYFEIQRLNGGGYNAVGRVYSRGDSDPGFSYSWEDNNTPEGITYYRLAMTSKDGKIEYSPLVKVEKRQPKRFAVFPTTVQAGDEITVSCNNTSRCSLQVSGANGKLISRTAFSGKTIFSTSSLPAGTYTFVMENNGYRETSRILVINSK